MKTSFNRIYTSEVLGDANHGYRGHEQEIADAVAGWLKEIISND